MADFHLSYAADPAASSRLGSAVWIAGAQAVEHLDLKVASSVLDLRLADCEAARRALLPADCSALAEADFRAQRKADRYVAELPAPHSALADWPPVDCLVRDDLARGDCSGSAPAGWDDCPVRLMVVDRCAVVLVAVCSASDDSVPAYCLAPGDLVPAGCWD